MNTELTHLSVREMRTGLRKGKFSCRELMAAHLDRINKLESKIHAFITLEPEKGMAQATEADRQLAAINQTENEDRLPLLGIPIAVKDLIAVEGIRCTCGSRVLGDFVSPYTATAVQRLVDAGAIIVGKTNTDEFAMGSSTETSAFGPTFNPWDLSRVPGGSSGGSAAAVAARMIPAAIGSDTGGSVRQPASFCGITGLKPTYGRVSRYGLVAYGSSLDSMGVLARNTEDIADFLGIMAGVDTHDSTTMDVPFPDIEFSKDLSLAGLRIGLPDEYFLKNGIQPDVENRIGMAIRIFKDLGAEIIHIKMAHTRYALPVYYLIAPAEASANLARFDGVRYGLREKTERLMDMYRETRGEGFGAEVKRRIMLGTYALSAGYYDAYYGQAQKVRTLIKRDFETAFEKVDVIACPVTPSTAFKLGEHSDDPLAMYLEDVFTLPANLAGVPALAFPIGEDSNQLPVGMQIMGSQFQEKVLLKTVHSFQKATRFNLSNPAI